MALHGILVCWLRTFSLQSLQLDLALKHCPCSWIGPLNLSQTTKLLPTSCSASSRGSQAVCPRSRGGHCIPVTWVTMKPVHGHKGLGYWSMQSCYCAWEGRSCVCAAGNVSSGPLWERRPFLGNPCLHFSILGYMVWARSLCDLSRLFSSPVKCS